MDLLHLVDRLEELVATAQKMPIGSRAIVDRRRLLDIVDQMRIAIPQEVREAQDMIEHRDELAREADEDAKLIVARAEQRALRMVEENEITTAARARAEEIALQTEARLNERIEEANQDIQERLSDSRRVSQEQLDAADEYARELLQRLSKQLRAFTRSVDTGISQLEPVRAAARPAAAYDEFGDVAVSEYDDEALPARPRAAAVVRDDSESDASMPVGAHRRGRAVIDDFEYPELDDDPNARG